MAANQVSDIRIIVQLQNLMQKRVKSREVRKPERFGLVRNFGDYGVNRELSILTPLFATMLLGDEWKRPRRIFMLKDAPIRAYIPASNIIRARKFYEEVIGLQPKAEYAGGVVYECGGASVFMYPTPNAGTSKASQAFWQVKDVEAEVAELKARGVKFEEYDMPVGVMRNSIATAGGAKTAWFKDPEGNILAISQRI